LFALYRRVKALAGAASKFLTGAEAVAASGRIKTTWQPMTQVKKGEKNQKHN
jgi:hypothetical protein